MSGFNIVGRKMARKAKKKEVERNWFEDLSPQAKQAIVAVLVAVLGVFLLAAMFDFGGLVGDATNTALSWLFGIAAYIAPLICFFYVAVILNPGENEKISLSKMIGISLLFVSILGAVELYQEDLGGMVGYAIVWPLTLLLGNIVTGFFLFAFMVIATVLTFNIGLTLPKFSRERTESEDDEEMEIALPEEVEEEAPEENPAEEDEEEEVSPAPVSALRRVVEKATGKATPGEFIVSTFSGPYAPPSLKLLKRDTGKANVGDVKANANTIKRTLKEFGINVEMDGVEIGPTIARYAIKPAQGVKISRIVGLQQNLELDLASGTIRIEAPIPGKSLVGIEVPNLSRATIGLASLLRTPEFTDSPHPLLVALGKDVTGNAHFTNVARMPHSLIAGTTGSGKSIAIHNLIISMLFRNSPDQLRFIMVDPKRVEMTLYEGIPHLLTPVITEAKKALNALKWAVKEMERRYDILQTEGVQNIDSYHSKIYRPAKEAWEKGGSNEEERANLPEPLPYVVVVIDELADLMHAYPKELEACIVRLAQMSRAVGIHLILATQRPSVNVITGTIKANIPTRLALNVASQIDSRTILDSPGAEKLLGKGDMLFLSSDAPKPVRLQSAFISEDEIKNVVKYLKSQSEAHTLDSIDLDEKAGGTGDSFIGLINGSGGEDDDDLYEDARIAVIEAGRASTSYLQRKLRVGYSRAARLIDLLEERGVIGPQDGSKPRTILDNGGGGEDYGEEYDAESLPDDGSNLDGR